MHIIKGYGDTAVAEHSIALLLASCRDIARMDREVRAGTWTPHEGVQLLGKTLGVIGLGGIGSEVMRIGRGLGMEVIAWNRTPKPGAPLVALDELLARSDVISMNLTLSDETRGFLGAAQFARMKPGVIFVNTARAGLVDEAAFIEALRSGRIRHAGLDVFHSEPLKPDHPLAGMANVTLTAHAAFRTLEASMTLLRRSIDIVKNILPGRRKSCVVLPVSHEAVSVSPMGERFCDISLRVNGEGVSERVEARKTLVDFLRDDLGLTGSHVGCEQGVCGACTVLVDGAVVRGCLVLAAQCDGAEVQTIEGISDSGAIADLQEAFHPA